jgi:hypothetical protein
MLEDIVIDTNVLAHSQNPNEVRYQECCEMLNKLLQCSTVVAVDEGFSLNRANNRSHIGHEYLENLSHGSLAFSVLSKLAVSKRVKFLPKRAPRREQRIINQSVRNRFDRAFLGVAFNSTEGIFVSHDFQDFQPHKRSFILRELAIDICEAQNSLAVL